MSSVPDVRRQQGYSPSSRVAQSAVLVRRENTIRGSSRAATVRGNVRAFAILDDDERCELLQKIFERSAYKGQRDMPWGSGAPFSAGVENGQETIASTTYTSRAGQDIPDAAFIDTAHYTNPISSNFTYQAQGITTAQYFPLSIIRFYLAYHRLLQAERLGDVEGQKLAKADMATKMFSIAGGLSYAIARPLSLAATITHVSASSFTETTQLGSATFAVPTIGIWLFCIAGAISSVKSGWSIYKGLNLQSKLTKIEGMQDKIAYLEGLLKPNAKELAEINTANEEELINAALEQGAEELFSLVKELSKDPSSKIPNMKLAQCKELLETQLVASGPQAMVLRQALIEQGMKVKMANLQLKKEKQLERIIGDECVQMIKGKKDSKEILDKVELHVDGQRIISSMNIAANVFNTIGVILAIVVLLWVTGGLGFLALSYIAAVASFLYGGTGLILDAYACKQGLETAKPGPWDKGLLTVGVIANWASFIVGVTLMCLLGPIIPGALAIAIGLFLFLNVMHYYTWSKTRANQEFDIAKFRTALEGSPAMTTEKVAKLFKKLSHNEQTGLGAMMVRTNGKKSSYSREEVINASLSYEAQLKAAKERRERIEKIEKAKLAASLSSVVNGFLKQRQLASA